MSGAASTDSRRVPFLDRRRRRDTSRRRSVLLFHHGFISMRTRERYPTGGRMFGARLNVSVAVIAAALLREFRFRCNVRIPHPLRLPSVSLLPEVPWPDRTRAASHKKRPRSMRGLLSADLLPKVLQELRRIVLKSRENFREVFVTEMS